MHAAAVRFDLHIPESRSLKVKRAAVRPIVDGLRHRYHLSVAEIGHQDQWQRAELGVAVLPRATATCARCSTRSSGSCARAPDVEVLDVEVVHLDGEGTLDWDVEEPARAFAGERQRPGGEAAESGSVG